MIGGLDVSYVKGDPVTACVGIVVCLFPSMKPIHVHTEIVQMTEPYISGYLGFKEANTIAEQIQHIKHERPNAYPDAFLIDGNGVLHPRRFGLACHVGVLTDHPTIGVAKSLHFVDGVHKNIKARCSTLLIKPGDVVPLSTDSEEIIGMALKPVAGVKNPIYISVGHRFDLETAVWLVKTCCHYRIPEPIRLADIYSRQHLQRMGFSKS
ncbi:unnamed protein product [Darwinula stevensoni]|uniref:Endonuclease V n=1 Tax=Darwinula stevensoni TaxID=69355 RepID=A0A7R9A7W6_9CRUS|nr:unnamed protein product [Darwinula stevensoni]CAG0893821.1 unnamed protein product [Darwinula stevensoni]